MDIAAHNLSTLFEQLGLPADANSVDAFIHKHRPLDPKIPLHQATWWAPDQAEFLVQAIEEDSDWSEEVDELDALLRFAPDAS
ncbi:MAG: DUF2789 domain-containing protein [Phycisphaerales bacterium]|nr:DUF2789 domain-containing protein [Phycisphaerales bacterium]